MNGMRRIETMDDLDSSQDACWKDENGCWWVYLIGCGAGILSNHNVEEHVDGSISVTPSILMYGHKDGVPSKRHGFLVRGEWKDC